MKKLIINADDFGLTPGISHGIIESIREGVVRSTSALVCGLESPAHIKTSVLELSGRVGVHLQLTDGVPCSDPSLIPSLVGQDNKFPRSRKGLGSINPDEVEREWHAQVERFMSMGIKPSHIDTHHHVHILPQVVEAYCEIARYYKIPARTYSIKMTAYLRDKGVSCADYCETGWWGGELTIESLIACVTRAFMKCGGEGTVELMCHPGIADHLLAERSNYVIEREAELRVLCNPALAQRLSSLSIEVTDISALTK